MNHPLTKQLASQRVLVVVSSGDCSSLPPMLKPFATRKGCRTLTVRSTDPSAAHGSSNAGSTNRALAALQRLPLDAWSLLTVLEMFRRVSISWASLCPYPAKEDPKIRVPRWFSGLVSWRCSFKLQHDKNDHLSSVFLVVEPSKTIFLYTILWVTPPSL